MGIVNCERWMNYVLRAYLGPVGLFVWNKSFVSRQRQRINNWMNDERKSWAQLFRLLSQCVCVISENSWLHALIVLTTIGLWWGFFYYWLCLCDFPCSDRLLCCYTYVQSQSEHLQGWVEGTIPLCDNSCKYNEIWYNMMETRDEYLSHFNRMGGLLFLFSIFWGIFCLYLKV